MLPTAKIAQAGLGLLCLGINHYLMSKKLDDFIDVHYNHTVGQPVCQSTLQQFLNDDLSKHFKDVFLPMAHSMDIAPSEAACMSWTIEYSMYLVLNSGAPRVFSKRETFKREKSQGGKTALRGALKI